MLLRSGQPSEAAADDGANDGAAQSRRNSSRWTRAGTACAATFGAILLSSIAVIAWHRAVADSPPHGGRTLPASAAAIVPATVPVTGTEEAPARSSTADRAASRIPAQVTWLQVGLGALPFSRTAGPARIRAGVPSGFAHTQAGAVQAALQILGRLSWSAQTRASMRAVITASTTPAAQAQVVLAYGPPTDPSVVPQVAGFQIVAYSDTQAIVNLALRFNGVLRVSPATMQWVAPAGSGGGADGGLGDWELAGAPGPLSQTSWAVMDDLTGYILFSGQPTNAGD